MSMHQRRLDLKNGCVDLSHGAGGRAMAQLIAGLFHEAFGNEWLATRHNRRSSSPSG
ncbi:MAG: hydrogenase expression/formation protein HypE, partial [Bradyrhizobium sp.]